MKKTTKRLALILALALVVAACGLLAIGCGDNNPPEETPTAKAYTVKVVYADGTAVDGTTGTGGPNENVVMVQICHLNADGETVNCYNKTALSDKGEWSVDASKLPELKAGEKFHVEIDGLPEGCTYDATAANTYFTAPGTTTVTVTKPAPEPDKKQTYTVSAKDGNNNPVADAWLEMFYYADAVNYGDPTVVGTAKTDANGVATFEIEPTDGIDYYVQSAGHGEKVTDPAVNYKYSPTDMNAKFDGKTATFTYDYYPSAFNANYAQVIKYSRIYKDGNAVEADDNEDLTLSLSANEYTYFYFNPYVAPDAEEASNEDRANAQAAASGIYEITFAATPDTANVTMFYYFASTMMNADRIPTQIGKITGTAPSDAENAELYTGNSKVELELKTDALNARLFGIVATSACTVTVSATRTGDAEAVVERTLVDKTSEATKEWTEADLTEDGVLTPVPLNFLDADPVTVTKDADGYYHYGSTDEDPILYVMLTKALGRANSTALSKLSEIVTEGGPLGESVYHFEATDNDTDKYNFAPMIATYAALVKNDEGIYPVTEELKEYLIYFGNSGNNSSPFYGVNNWLVPCQYFDANASLNTVHEGTNVLTLSEGIERFDGKMFTFTSESGGSYTITVDDSRALVFIDSPYDPVLDMTDNSDENDSYVFTLEPGESFKFGVCDFDLDTEGEFNFTLNISSENSDTEDDTEIKVGVNNIADTDGYALPYTLVINQSGWYIFSLPSTDNLSITLFEDEDDYFGTLILNYSEEGEDGEDYSMFPMYFEAGEYALEVMTTGTTLTMTATTEPKFAVGSNGTEITVGREPMTLALDSTEEATYKITIVPPKFNQPEIKVTIGQTTYTFNTTDGYSVNDVTISAGAEITVSCPSSFSDVTITVLFEGEEAEEGNAD